MGQVLDNLRKRVNKEAKEDVFVKGMLEYKYDRIPFTSPKMNFITYGGLPLGRLVEFFGEEGGGKTTTALDIVANFQNMYPDREVLYVDAENTLDIDWARKIGVDVNNICLYQPKLDSAEYIFQIIKEATMSGEIGLWVLDSIPCLTSENDLDKELTDSARVAGVSGILTRFAREIVGPCAKNNCMGIGINQLRDKINSTVPGMTNTPGGRGWRHFCTTRIQFMTGSYMNEDGKTISKSAEGSRKRIIQVNMVKTKSCRPDRHVGHYTIDFDAGIDYLADLIEQAMYYDIIDKSGSWFTFVDTETGEVIFKLQGQNNVSQYLDEHPEIMVKIEELVNNKMGLDF